MNAFLSIIIFLIVGISVSAQPIERRVADSLFKVLTKEKQGIERIKALNALAQFYIFKPGENQIDFDSASTYLNEARRLNKFVKSTPMVGQLLRTEFLMLREQGQKKAAILKAEEAIKIFESGNDHYYLGKTLFELSGYYDFQIERELEKKIKLVERSVAAYEHTDNTLERAEVLKMLGDLYNIDEKYAEALKVLNHALADYEQAHYKPLQGIYSLLSVVNTSLDDYKQALYYGLLSVKTADICHDTTEQVCQINYNMAIQYGRYGSYEKALKYYKDALKIAIRYNNSLDVALIAYSISVCYSSLNQSTATLGFLMSLPPAFVHSTNIDDSTLFSLSFMEAYLSMENYTKAHYYFKILSAIKNSNAMAGNLVSVFNRMAADYFFRTGDYARAHSYISENKAIYSKSAGPRSFSRDEKLRYKIDSAMGRYEEAFYHLLNHKTISDSLLNETKTRQLQQLEVEFETAKKDDSLKQQSQHISLLQQRNGLQRSNLRQADLIKNISIIGTVFILIVLVLLYYQFRKNQRSNKIILQKNEALKHMLSEKEWWLKEVHHRVKNNLHTIICLLESQAMYLEKDALQAIEKSQHRIYAMSLIHQKLYQNEDLQVIDMSVYLEEFIGYLKDSFDAQQIDFILHVEPIDLNLQQAIPVALIINEAVTNSIKYAFEYTNEPGICISMNEKNESVKLMITDNGKGFEMKEENEGKSLGMQLIKGLTKELKGTISIDTKEGTALNIEFKRVLHVDEIAYLKTGTVKDEA